jgi:hypothetical protein
MTKNMKGQSDEEKILHAFADLLDDVIPENIDEIEALLREVDLDPKQIEAETRTLIEEVRASTPLDWRNKRSEIKTVVDKHEKLKNQIPADRQGMMQLLSKLISPSRSRTRGITAHFRNQKPEEMTDEELQSFLQDILFTMGDSEQGDNE